MRKAFSYAEQPLGAGLLCIGEVHAVVATIAEEATEGG